MGITLGRVVVAAAMLLLSSCGPRHLSALGNPGDFCTEESSCTDGTTCRATSDGYRCVGNDEAERSRTKAMRSMESPRQPIIEDDDENLQPTPQSGRDVEEDDTSSFDFSEEGDEEEEDDGYVPPSRRRRGNGG